MQQQADQSIAVLGAGSWGTALSLSLARKGLDVYLWDRETTLLEQIASARCNTRYLPDVPFPDNLNICFELQECLASARDILLVVPSHAFSSALRAIKPFLKPEQRIVWATKGLELETGNFLHEVAKRELGDKRLCAVLSGPSFAKEVAVGLPTAVALASEDLNYCEILATKFRHDNFRVETTQDMIGVQLGGVVKNVLAVAVGMSDGLGLGANAKAALMTLGLAEMMTLGKALGASPEALMGLAGCGDVILTCTDNQSRNRRFGLALAKGLSEAAALEQIGQVVEAVYNVEQLCRLAKMYKVELPIAEQVFAVLKQGVLCQDAIKALFKRVSGGE